MRDARAFRVFGSVRTHRAYFWLESLREIARKSFNKIFADVENTSTPVALPFTAEIILCHFNYSGHSCLFSVPWFPFSSTRWCRADPSEAETMTMAVIETAGFGEFHIPEFGSTPPGFDA
jgi:hypothetical protein